ncbi:alpha/beta hydrolase [Estrella lausannensis]|uniref:Phospholipase/Carboxylesterase n=1 Tax=Estrella lausannensis TaxID=483423 RepID=A0A0H5DPL1_9BACT|nr:dienelactone hydrolase family protein [Estrella lausannensis]CRX37938.1 Phospholipase/Carboxylesterase [Estrella lausannensis]
MIKNVLHRGPPASDASGALILLHGRGGTARGILSLSELLCGDDYYIAAPQAVGNVWYPHSFLEDETFNEPYLSQSISGIQELIEETASHMLKNRIFIAGFSQGACLALEVTARSATLYGGIIAFTGGLIGKEVRENRYRGDFKGTKVFISNGDHDSHIPLRRSQESKTLMEKLGALVTLKIYEGRDHTIVEDEIKSVKETFFSP